jgi:hypothetical protein
LFSSPFFLFFWGAANELLKAVQTIRPKIHTHCSFGKGKKKTLILLFFLVCGEEFKKVLSFSAFSSYQLLLFRTLCVCVSVVKITQTKKMQVVVVVFSLAGGPKFRADGLLSQTIKKHLPLL